jgi:16S rRNA (guanine527-N7)-methyltransferase
MSPREEFIRAIELHQPAFGFDLSADVVGRLADHLDLVTEHNLLLHLTAPMSAEEFAVRHVLESLAMLEFLPAGASFADIGSGAGFPAIPCLIARDDLRAVLIESKEKRAGFLQTVIAKCELGRRAEVISKQFSETPRPDVSYVSCRALDRFTQHLPKLIKWSGNCSLLFFGGPTLRHEMRRLGLITQERLMPMSEKRYLFAANR